MNFLGEPKMIIDQKEGPNVSAVDALAYEVSSAIVVRNGNVPLVHCHYTALDKGHRVNLVLFVLRHLVVLFNKPSKPEVCWSSRR